MSIMNDEITAKATIQAKAMKKKLARSMVDHLPEEASAVSVFMAGSPGAGKTEAAKSFIHQFSNSHDISVVHIENDELRKEFKDYTRYHSKCVISVGTKNDLGKALN